MKRVWTTTKLVAAVSLAALTLILSLLGAGIVAVTAIPLMGGLINVFVATIMIMLCLFVIDQFGAVTIRNIVLGILQLPFPLNGTPGFLPKVPILILQGVIIDVLYLLLKRNELIASVVIGGLSQLYIGVAVVEVGRLFGMPGIEQTSKLLYSPLVIAVVLLGAIGGYLGYLIYEKIKDTAVVRRIQG